MTNIQLQEYLSEAILDYNDSLSIPTLLFIRYIGKRLGYTPHTLANKALKFDRLSTQYALAGEMLKAEIAADFAEALDNAALEWVRIGP